MFNKAKAIGLKYKLEEMLGDAATVEIKKDKNGKSMIEVEIKDDEFTTEKYGIKIHFTHLNNKKKRIEEVYKQLIQQFDLKKVIFEWLKKEFK